MVVLAWRPTAERLIKGAVLAMMNAIAAVTVNASGKSIGSAMRVATVQAQRGQRAFAPGGNSGNSCKRSQSGQAIVSIVLTSGTLMKRVENVHWTLVQYETLA
jgi:hypothetical protein